MQADNYHVPVLLKEVLDGLNIHPGGIYVDCTFGGGGHSMAILSHLSSVGRLIVFDQDEEARQNLPGDKRITYVPANFKHLQRFLRLNRIERVDGILADLGVSSHQFDEPNRGFSFRYDAFLDMRMDQNQELTAMQVLQNYPEDRLHKLFEQYGQVTNAKTLAKAIINSRNITPLQTIAQFRVMIENLIKGNPNKYLAQVFQALRIEVNDEMSALKEMLKQAGTLLLPGGRIAIITFHSLEDRIVKDFFRYGTFDIQTDHVYGITEKSPYNIITKKPITPSGEEIKKNSRARSAKLRIAELR